MPTTTVSTIGSGGDYSTLQAWEDAAAANLVTADEVWEGRLISASTNISGTGVQLTVSGSTTDATRYKHLTTAPGASFRDHVDALTNPLRFDSAKGASIESTTYYLYAINVTEQNFHLSNLQVRDVNGTQAGAIFSNANGIVLENSIFEGTITGSGNGVVSIRAAVARNCLFIQRRASAATYIAFSDGVCAFYNCTFAVPSDLPAATNGIRNEYGSLTIRNCGVFGATADVSLGGGSTLSATTCYTDDASPSTGFTTLAYSGAFENTADATRDFRIPSTSGLKDVGTTDATNAPTDIIGTSRPQGAGYDVGCWELFGGSAATLDQIRFRWRNDDGDEDGATWAAAENANITAPLG